MVRTFANAMYALFEIDKDERSLSLLMLRQADNILAQELTGSRVICNPPPIDTDLDVVVLVKDLYEFVDDSQKRGWDIGGSRGPNFEPGFFEDCDFCSITSGTLNLICTQRPEWYERFVAASVVATRLNLMHKCCRITLFSAFRYNL